MKCAEKLFGHSQDNDNSVLISIHHGLGAGIILDGRVLQGRHGNIGELGHIQIDKEGKLCHCGPLAYVHFGYQGPDGDGGYLLRGFNDLTWLPDPGQPDSGPLPPGVAHKNNNA